MARRKYKQENYNFPYIDSEYEINLIIIEIRCLFVTETTSQPTSQFPSLLSYILKSKIGDLNRG